ncbi:hypothetical protein [Corynebacterium pacaense]|uniref:hypothetical protein n=1 Tax=Corynebacterium pacaense TaxID=1816684 RepID=UPI0009B94F7A|nr:hypothetical protein [Corynebacterium pacaense]
MNRRHNGGDRDGREIVNEQLKKLFEDDSFLSDLSRGVDPSEGSDPLAGLLLDFGREVNADMPPVPDLESLLPPAGQASPDASPRTTEFTPVTPEADGATDVVDLGERREARRNRKSHPFLSGLVGAAAATLLIAGGGTAVYNADADSPLYGIRSELFHTDDPSVVELASTLEEVDSRTANGDVEGARELLEQARAMIGQMQERQRGDQPPATESAAPATSVTTETLTTTEAPAAPAAPETVTHTETYTTTVQQTIIPAPVYPTVAPTQTLAPPQTITVTSTPGEGGLTPPQG